MELPTPLLEYKSSPLKKSILLKMEASLPGGSYKIRGVKSYFQNTLNLPSSLEVLSAGNLALATAMECQPRGISCRAIVPAGFSSIKKKKLMNVGAHIQEEPFQKIWELVLDESVRRKEGFIHPFNSTLLSGYGSIADEILHQCPDSQGIVIPYGLGGLTLSVVQRLRQLGSQIPIYVCEIEGYSPLSRALTAHHPHAGPKLQSFIEAMGTPCVIPEIFEALRHQIKEVILVTEDQVRQGIREIDQNIKVRVEGAAGASFVAAQILASRGLHSIIALITGANISDEAFYEITGSHHI